MRVDESGPYILRAAQPQDLPALKALFAETFEESPHGLDLFFSRAFSPERTVVAFWNGILCGMFYILPATLLLKGQRLPCAYLYALAVSAAYRKKGVGSAILRYLDDALPTMGYAAAALVPATPNLFDYYARFGYTNVVYAARWETSAASLPDIPAQIAEHTLFVAQRERFFAACTPFFSWEDEMLAYAQDYLHTAGGHVLRIRTPQEEAYACCVLAQDRLDVLELCGQNVPGLLGALCRHTGAQRVRVHLRADAPWGTALPYGAMKWFRPHTPCQGGYMALTLE